MPFLQSDVFRYIARGHAVNFPPLHKSNLSASHSPRQFSRFRPPCRGKLTRTKGQRLTVSPLPSGNILCSAHFLSVAPLMGSDRKWRYFVLNHGVPTAAVERTSWQIAAATVRECSLVFRGSFNRYTGDICRIIPKTTCW